MTFGVATRTGETACRLANGHLGALPLELVRSRSALG